MQLTLRSLMALALAAAAHLAIGSAPGYACTQPPGGVVVSTVTTRTMQADHVFVGTVLTVAETAPGFSIYSATIAISNTLKGQPGLIQATIGNYGMTSLCLTPVAAGQAFLFFVRGDAATGYFASNLEIASAVSPVSVANMAEAVAASPDSRRQYLPIVWRS